jgi:hypothetical protein
MTRTITILLTLNCLVKIIFASEWQIKLEVKELWGKPGLRRVTGGVPLLAGQAKEPSELRICVKNESGNFVPVPAQFRVLARWWRQDNSIRWVLTDFATEMQANETKTFYLVGSTGLPAPPATRLTVRETEEFIEVTTGPARFVVNRKKFAFLDKVFIDSNGDGVFDESENLLDTSPDSGMVVEDTYGERYYGSESVRNVEVLESGPMRVCIRARGRHQAREGRGYSRGMYGYDCFLNFYADSTDVYTDIIIGNHPPRSIGSPTFEDASLFLKLAETEPEYWIQGEHPLQGKLADVRDIRENKYSYTLKGNQIVEGKLAKNESVCIYQDSNGAETWESCQGYDDNSDKQGWTFPEGLTSSFRGYRVIRRTSEGEQILTNGDHARGLVRVHTQRGGVVVHTKHFWQQFPKAVEVFGDGRLRIGFFPREYKVPHFLEDTSAKGHELIFHFYAPNYKGPYPADSAGRPDPSFIADCWDSRVYPRPPIEHSAATGALADLGPFTVPVTGLNDVPDSRNSIDSRRMFTTDIFYGNAFGWQIFGERWRSQGGAGRHGARQPMEEDDYLRRWYWTGVRDWLAVGDARSRHFRDVRGYRIEEQDPFGFKDWTEFRYANMSEQRADRPQPNDDEYKKYTQGLWYRVPFWLPNPEHNVLDLLYDRYLLFGDVRCLENMRIVAATAGYYTADHEPVVFRAPGWCWRSVVRYWELTGDPDARRMLDRIARTYSALIGKTPLVCRNEGGGVNWWFTTIFCRGVALAALHTGDPVVLELARSCAVGKESMEKARRVSTLFAVLYHLTGDENYRKAVDRPENDNKNLTTGGYLFVCDHWLLHQPPREKPNSNKMEEKR